MVSPGAGAKDVKPAARQRRTDRVPYDATETDGNATEVTGLERAPEADDRGVDAPRRVQVRQ